MRTTSAAPLALLNTTIATSDGHYELRAVTLGEARQLVKDRIYEVESGQQWDHPAIVSHVGHEATAQMLSSLLGIQVAVNRAPFAQQPGQAALCFKVRGRPAEGTILSVAEVEAMGYELKLLTLGTPRD